MNRSTHTMHLRRVATKVLVLVGSGLMALSASAETDARKLVQSPGSTLSDLAVHLEALKTRLERGEKNASRDWLKQLSARYKVETVTLQEAVTLGTLLARVGLDADASRYFRAAAGRGSTEEKMEAVERSALAGAVYAIGKPAAAHAILARCRAAFPNSHFRCKPWAMAEIAAAKEDWEETGRLLDAALLPGGHFRFDTGQTAPIRVLKMRLKAAWHRGDKMDIGRWRALLIRRGVSPDRRAPATPLPAMTAGAKSPSRPRDSGLIWLVIGLSAVLFTALILARRSDQPDHSSITDERLS